MKLLLLLVVGLVHIAIAHEQSSIQASYKSLTDCQLNICKQLYNLEGLNSDADKLKFVACQSGCNINVIDGLSQCDSKCESMYQDDERKDERDACKHSCKTFSNNKVEDGKNVATLDRPSRPFINGKRPIMDIKVLDSNGNWVNPQDKQQEEELNQNVDGIFNVLSSLLNRGEPNMIAIDEPVDEDTQENQEEEGLTTFGKLHNFYNSIFDKMMNVMNSKMANDNDNNDSGFYYYAQILSNGTVIESVKRPFIKLFGGSDDIDSQMFNKQEALNHLRCHPISFNWRNMCHDANNLFNCLSIRYGLPKWFFLSLTLVSSFLMIWMGLYILAMIKHVGRREVSSFNRHIKPTFFFINSI